MTLQSKAPIGLDGVPAAETALSHVDGERGELIIDGQRVDDLIKNTSFEGVAARLWSAAHGAGSKAGLAVPAHQPHRIARQPARTLPSHGRSRPPPRHSLAAAAVLTVAFSQAPVNYNIKTYKDCAGATNALNVTKVSGSSLTSGGFKIAIAAIKEQALES